jgi:cell division protein FtsB
MRARRKKNKTGRTLLKQAQVLMIIILVVLIFVIARVIYFRVQDERNINKGVEALQSEMEKFDQENKDLNKLVKYFDSADFQEKEIKGKLNLVKEGEKVVFVQGNSGNNDDEGLVKKEKTGTVTTVHTNYYYWWKYFFGGKI